VITMMDRLKRSLSLQSRVGSPAGAPAFSGVPDAGADEGTSRRGFLEGTAGAAAGAAVILATPKVASIALDSASSPAAEPKAVVTEASGPAPHEPVSAYVRDADRGEVTVMSGTQETTYLDPVLVKRLLDAAN
jgi:hypothetical protein